ncbi:MAG: TIGR01440 family protein [Oscillospiraceae bacterium]|nr:TIGR01440 family protein [Oscillospiraceae bacterium]
MDKIKTEALKAVEELIEHARLGKNDVLVIGCSTSEVLGEKIGTASSVEAAKAIFDVVYPVLKEKGIFLAAQCCEHLNRALVVEQETAEKYFLEQVNAIPQPKAGGSFASVCYANFESPVVVETLGCAKAGLDIGDTLIGMHLKKVAVPVRLSVKQIGNAHLLAARTRPKFTGGERAVYNAELL